MGELAQIEAPPPLLASLSFFFTYLRVVGNGEREGLL